MPEDQDPKSPFNEEQVASLKQLVSGIVNSAIRTRDQMADKKRQEDRDAIQGSFAKLLDEKLAALKAPEPEPNPKDGKDGGRRKDLELELSTLRKEQLESRNRMEAAEKRAAEARARVEAAELRDRVAKTLAPTGIEGNRFHGAYAILKERIRKQSEDDGAPYVFVDDDGSEVDLEPGLKGWTKTDMAKIYLPPSGAGGSGARRVASANGAGGKSKGEVTYEDVGNAILNMRSPFGGGRLGE